MNIILRELRAHLKPFLIWSGCIIGFIFILMSEYTAFHDNPDMIKVFDAMPKEMMAMFGLEGSSLSTPQGFISMASVYFYVMLAIYSGMIGSGILAKEERDKTTEFFLVLPVSRTRIIISKLVASIILSLGMNLVFMATIFASVVQYDTGDEFTKFVALMMSGIFMLQILFMLTGMFLSAVMKNVRQCGKVNMGIVVGLYMVSIFIALDDRMENLKYMTPFKYFEASTILREMSLDWTYIIIAVVVSILLTVGTFVFYPKRDLSI